MYTNRIKYILITFLILTGVFVNVKVSSAGWDFSTYDIPYTVTTSNIAPIANAGSDRDIVLPVDFVTINDATESDADGNVTSRSWVQMSGPSTATITDIDTLTPTFSNLVSNGPYGVYLFQLQVTDNDGASSTDSMVVKVFPIGSTVNSPIANAGPDKTIILPVSNTSVTGSGTDSDGFIKGYQWTQISGPGTAQIMSPSSDTTNIIKLNMVGDYVFKFTVTDNDDNTGEDTMIVHVKPVGSPGGATGTLTISPNTCTIPLNTGTCLAGDVNATWNTTGTTSPNLWNGSSTLSSLANNSTPFPVGSSVGYPSRTFYLRDGTTNLDSPKTVTANCGAGGTWDSGVGKCVSSSVAGACGPTHDTNPCAVGTVVNPPGIQTGSTSWTWTCIEDIVSPQCSQTFPVTQCNDNADNDSDGLKDKFDPGCHTDGIVISGNEDQTYDPLDTNEKNNPKVKVKEL